jgi:hypothetical protein
MPQRQQGPSSSAAGWVPTDEPPQQPSLTLQLGDRHSNHGWGVPAASDTVQPAFLYLQ